MAKRNSWELSESRLSRRSLLAAAAATPFAASLASCGAESAAESEAADIVIVGSGAAGSVAALFAHAAGASVMIVEAADHAGGTSAKSAGSMWIPNNAMLRERGQQDSLADFLRFASRSAYPESFDPESSSFGLPEASLKLLTTFYQQAPQVIESLREMRALDTTTFEFGPASAPLMPDYYDNPEFNPGSAKGRVLQPRGKDGHLGGGDELMTQLSAALAQRRIPVLIEHRVADVTRSTDGRVSGIVCETPQGSRRIAARRGVVFASGGYAHNPELLARLQPNPIFGGCALPTSRGDFITIAERAGAQLGNAGGAWRAQVVLEETRDHIATPQDVWAVLGDSSLMVDRFGRRAMNEKRDYHHRSKAMYATDPNEGGYRSLLHFMIYDQRVAELWAGNYPLPSVTDGAPYVISSPTLAGLAEAIRKRLDDLGGVARGVRLAPDFASNLAAEVAQYGRYARAGADPQFRRGEGAYDVFFHLAAATKQGTRWPANPYKNPTMHPLREEGPYYALILAPGTLDTNGGPVIDEQGRVIDAGGKPIAGLYGAGNCIASAARDTYWAAGATLGNAITFGAIAGRSAARGA